MSNDETELQAVEDGSDAEPVYELTASDKEDLVQRAALAGALGHETSHGGSRDYYSTFGWDPDPGVEDYLRLYKRGGYAATIVDAPVDTAWRNDPDVSDRGSDDADDPTPFEDDVTELIETRRLWHYAKRIDRLAGIGEFGIMLVRYADGGDWRDPVDRSALARHDSPAERVVGFKPLTEHSVEEVIPFPPDHDRWGEPQGYKIDLTTAEDEVTLNPDLFAPDDGNSNAVDAVNEEMWVHAERALHVPSDKLLDDEIRAVPRQEPVYNNLLDIMKVRGAAAEHAYRGLDYGLHAKLDPEYRHDDGGAAAEQSIERYLHGLQPYIQTQGIDIEALGGETIDPGPVIDAELDEISATTRMPKSVLRGKEKADRAKSEDLREWYGHIAERQSERCTHTIARPLLDDFVRFGVVRPHDDEGYELPFPPLAELSEVEQADVAYKRSQAVKNLQTAMPGYGTAEWRSFADSGELPEPEDMADSDAGVEPADVEDLARRIEQDGNGNGRDDERPPVADGDS